MNPVHRLVHAAGNIARRQNRPVDHDDRQAELAGGDQLGLGARAAGILGDDAPDPVAPEQFAIAGRVEGAAGDLDMAIGQGQRPPGRIDKADEVVMLRLPGKGREMLASDGKKDPLGRAVQASGCGGQIGHHLPTIARLRLPRRAFERDQRHPRFGTGGNRVAADLFGERVGSVDHPRDSLLAQVASKPLDAAKATHPHRHRLLPGAVGASGIGQHCRKTGPCHGGGKAAGLGGAAKDEGAAHG